MNIGVTNVSNSVSSTAKVDTTKASDGIAIKSAETAKQTNNVASAKDGEAAVYEKSSGVKSGLYSINKMSKEDRANLVSKLKEDTAAREQNLINIVTDMMNKQGKAYSIATGDDSIWKFLANGDFTVDAATKAQAQEDISEDGYWGIKQTSQRLFDFASALAGDDEEKMKQMQKAMMKGFKEATGAWGKDLPEISQNTIDAANKLFDDYYASKQQ